MRKLWVFTLMTAAVLFCSAQAQAAAALDLAFNKYDVTIHCNNNVGDYCLRDKNIPEIFTFNNTAFYVNSDTTCPGGIPIAINPFTEILPGESKYSSNGLTFDAIYTTCLTCPANSTWVSYLGYCVCNEGLMPENGQCVAPVLACPAGSSGTYPNCYTCPPKGDCTCDTGYCGDGANQQCYPCQVTDCPTGYCGGRGYCQPCPVALSPLYEFKIKNGFTLADLFIFGIMTVKYEHCDVSLATMGKKPIYTTGTIESIERPFTTKSNIYNNIYIYIPSYTSETESGASFFWGIKK